MARGRRVHRRTPATSARSTWLTSFVPLLALALAASGVVGSCFGVTSAGAAETMRTVRISSLTGGCRITGSSSNIGVDVSRTAPVEIIQDCNGGDWTLAGDTPSVTTPLGKVTLDGSRVAVFHPEGATGFLVSNAHFEFANHVSRGSPLPNVGVELRAPLRPVKVLGIGDSWTASFAYYGDGSAMSPLALVPCRPGSGVLNDRCSSNSDLSWANGASPLSFNSSFGYSNSISWAAQLTRTLTSPNDTVSADFGDYRNYAVSGAEPKDFESGGQLYDLITRSVAYNPDLTFITLGGNPLLGEALFGIKGCDKDRDNGRLYDCVTRLLDDGYHVPARLATVYRELLDAPANHLVVMSYMSAGATYFPLNNYTIGEWKTFARALNDSIRRGVDLARQQLGTRADGRIALVPPVDPPTGIKTSASGPGVVECRRGPTTFKADGSSVLAEIVQADLGLSKAISFCGNGAQYLTRGQWKPAGTEIWFNSSDLGTHLTRLGNSQLADAALATMQRDHVGGL